MQIVACTTAILLALSENNIYTSHFWTEPISKWVYGALIGVAMGVTMPTIRGLFIDWVKAQTGGKK